MCGLFSLQDKHIAGIYHSNMRRARETAEIVAARLGDAASASSTVQDPLLAEGVPAIPRPPSTLFHPTKATVDACVSVAYVLHIPDILLDSPLSSHMTVYFCFF